MTREEMKGLFENASKDIAATIIPKMTEVTMDAFGKGLEEGIKIGGKILIDKACSWLISSFDQLHNEHGRKLEIANQDVFIEAFKKAMEE